MQNPVGPSFYFVFARLLMHFAHRVWRTFTPFLKMEIFCRLGLNFRFVARMEKLRLCPNTVVFPQFSHFAID